MMNFQIQPEKNSRDSLFFQRGWICLEFSISSRAIHRQIFYKYKSLRVLESEYSIEQEEHWLSTYRYCLLSPFLGKFQSKKYVSCLYNNLDLSLLNKKQRKIAEVKSFNRKYKFMVYCKDFFNSKPDVSSRKSLIFEKFLEGFRGILIKYSTDPGPKISQIDFWASSPEVAANKKQIVKIDITKLGCFFNLQTPTRPTPSSCTWFSARPSTRSTASSLVCTTSSRL